MPITFFVAQIFSFIGAMSNIVAMQLNKKRQIMICYIITNWVYAINYFLLGAYSGAILDFVAGIQIFINSSLESKGKKIPGWLIAIYFGITIFLGSLVFSSAIDIMPIICSIICVIIIILKKESSIRKFTLINMILWLTYDIIVKSYVAAISDFAILISTIIGIFRFDIKKRRKK